MNCFIRFLELRRMGLDVESRYENKKDTKQSENRRRGAVYGVSLNRPYIEWIRNKRNLGKATLMRNTCNNAKRS